MPPYDCTKTKHWHKSGTLSENIKGTWSLKRLINSIIHKCKTWCLYLLTYLCGIDNIIYITWKIKLETQNKKNMLTLFLKRNRKVPICFLCHFMFVFTLLRIVVWWILLGNKQRWYPRTAQKQFRVRRLLRYQYSWR